MYVEFILIVFLSAPGQLVMEKVDEHGGEPKLFEHEQDCIDHATQEYIPELLMTAPRQTVSRYVCLPLMTESV